MKHGVYECGLIWSRGDGHYFSFGPIILSHSKSNEEVFTAFVEASRQLLLGTKLTVIELSIADEEKSDSLKRQGWQESQPMCYWKYSSDDLSADLISIWTEVDSIWIALTDPPRENADWTEIWTSVSKANFAVGRIDRDEFRIRAQAPDDADRAIRTAASIGKAHGLRIHKKWGWSSNATVESS